ncbi:FecR protein [Pirellulimonas nuda]|uniref:FecR protein n=1 Tax=Pirellulimonas nuda TaxID=2528009 RepID=A0A518DBP1_9BACT|nr:FecR family protein [Pirellulimonas nuda]QDU88905.1 FecR protein [Pirellulimonas nuda]
MADNRLEQLIAQWLDGRIDAEGSQALQQLLFESADARSAFRNYALLDASLHEAAYASSSSGVSGPVARELRSSDTPQRPDSPATLAGAKLEAAPRVQRPAPVRVNRLGSLARVAAWSGAIAAGILVAFQLSRTPDGARPDSTPVAQLGSPERRDGGHDQKRDQSLRKPPAPVATLAFVKQAQWEPPLLDVGETILEGETVSLTQGTARISVGAGAEIIAEAPCSLTFLSTDRVQLHHGEVAVDVAHWASGFTVVTEDMNLVDLGTKFTVSTSPGAATEATVLEGVVRVHASHASDEPPRGLLMTEGQHVSIDKSGLVKKIEQKDVNPLLGRLDFGSALPYRPVVLHNTGVGLSVGDEDRHWRVVSGPTGAFFEPQFAAVTEEERRYLPNDPGASQWVSIRQWQAAAPNSTYTFQTKFELDDYDLSTMQLFGRFLADNGVSAVRVNGEPVHVQSWVDNVLGQTFGAMQFRFVNITEGLVKGQNVVEVDVRNGMMRQGIPGELSPIPNPMALRVEWYAFGRQLSVAKADAHPAALYRIDGYNPPMLARSGREG